MTDTPGTAIEAADIIASAPSAASANERPQHSEEAGADAPAPKKGITLEYPIVSASGQELFPAGTFITVRCPNSGALRGIKLVSLSQLEFADVETLAPRITTPVLHKQAVAAMHPADLMALGGEIMDFLLPGAVKKEALASLPQ